MAHVRIDELITVPVIKKLKDKMKNFNHVVLDSAPGASCTVVSTINDCDFCILVTEPTPFGLHDLDIAVSLVKQLKIPFGVVVNKAMNDERLINDYMKNQRCMHSLSYCTRNRY